MTLIIIVLCLVVQRYFELKLIKPSLCFFEKYYQFFEQRVGERSWWAGCSGVVLFLGSSILIYAVIVALFTHSLGAVFTFLFGLVVLWYYLNAQSNETDVSEACEADGVSVADVFVSRYRNIFVPLFWFIVAGPLPVILYAEMHKLASFLDNNAARTGEMRRDFAQKLLFCVDVLDWLPVRLLGLTYLLVGQFNGAFRQWCQTLRGFGDAGTRVVSYGMRALDWGEEMRQSDARVEVQQIEHLVTRALFVWVIATAIFTLGYWSTH